jgi:hypothetical protein
MFQHICEPLQYMDVHNLEEIEMCMDGIFLSKVKSSSYGNRNQRMWMWIVCEERLDLHLV